MGQVGISFGEILPEELHVIINSKLLVFSSCSKHCL